MRLSDLTYSLHTLWAVKARTVLTTLGIVIGVMSVVAVSSVGRSAQDLVLGEITALGTDLVTVMPGASEQDGPPASVMGVVTTTFKMTDYRALRRLPHVVSGSPIVRTLEAVTYNGRSISSFVIGSTEEMADMQHLDVAEGRFFSASDVESYGRVVVLGSQLASDLGQGRSLVGKVVRIKETNFQVLGVLKEKGSSISGSMDDTALVPITAVQKTILKIDYLQQAAYRVDDVSRLEDVKADFEFTLRRRHQIRDAGKDDFSVRIVSQAIDILSGVTDSIGAFLVMVTAISLIVGGINIMNIMYVAVRERTREIGLRKAVGAKPRRIFTQFLLESSVISFVGGLVGLLLGVGITYGVSLIALAYDLTWNFMVSGTAVSVSLIVSIGIGLSFGVGPAMAAARLDAIEALRYE